MKYKGKDFDIATEGDHVILQGLHEDYTLLGLNAELKSEAERACNMPFVNEDGDVEMDFDPTEVSHFVDEMIEERALKFITDFDGNSRKVVVNSHSVN